MEEIQLDDHIFITNIWDAKHKSAHYRAVISIFDPDSSDEFKIESPDTKHLVLKFHDVSSTMHHHYKIPTMEEVVEAINFARKFPNDCILIHCHAGISRSPAIALAIIADKIQNTEKAVDILYKEYPDIDPNMRILAYADKILNLGRGSLSLAVLNHQETVKEKENKKHFKLSKPKKFIW